MIRNIIGTILFALGVAGFVLTLQLGDLLPRVKFEGQVRAVLAIVKQRLDAAIVDGGGWIAMQDAGQIREGLTGERLIAAIGTTDAFLRQYRHVDPGAIILAEFSPGRQHYRLEYRGDRVSGEGLSQGFVALNADGKWDDQQSRWNVEWRPVKPFMLGGFGLLALLGLWLGLTGIYLRHLFFELLAASLAGVLVLVLLLFVGASLQFIDRHSYLGPEFFIQSIPLLLKQVSPFTIAFGVLAGATMVFGRLANDREEIILQFNGVRLIALFLPAAMVGAIFCGLNFFAAHYWAPEGEYETDMVPYRALRALVDRLPSGSYAFGHDNLPFALSYQNRTDDGFDGLTVVFFKSPDTRANKKKFEPHTIFSARRGRISYSDALGQVRFDLHDVTVLRFENWPWQPTPKSFYCGSLSISQPLFSPDTPDTAPAPTIDSADVKPLIPEFSGVRARSDRIKARDLVQLRAYIEEKEVAAESAREARVKRQAALDEQAAALAEIRREQMVLIGESLVRKQWELVQAKVTAIPNLPTDAPLSPAQFQQLAKDSQVPADTTTALAAQLAPTFQRTAQVRQQRIPGALKDEDYQWVLRQAPEGETELYKRWAITLAPVLFMAIAIPLGLLIRQGNLLVAFLVAVITVLLSWFVVMTYFEKLAKEVRWPWLLQQIDAGPWLALVAPTTSALLVASFLAMAAFGTRWLLPHRTERVTRTEDEEIAMRASTRRSAIDRAIWRARPFGKQESGDSASTPRRPWWHWVLPWKWFSRTKPMASESAADFAPPSSPAVRRRPGTWFGRIAAVRRAWNRFLDRIIGSAIDRYVMFASLVSLSAAFITVISLFVVVDYLVNEDFFKATAKHRNEAAAQEILAETGKPAPWLGESKTAKPPANATRIALEHYAARSPQMAYMLAPLVTLLALAFTITRLLRGNEFLVAQAGGISIWRMLRPMLALTGLIAVLMAVHQEWGAPYWAELMRQEGSFMDRKESVENKIITDTQGRAIWLQEYDVRDYRASGMVVIDFTYGFPAQIAHAAPVVYRPAVGWQAEHWRIMSLVKRHYHGLDVLLAEDIAVGGDPPGVRRPESAPVAADPPAVVVAADPLAPVPPQVKPLPPESWTIDPHTDVLHTPLKPADVNRRITQILEDLSISELWELSLQRPEWNAPKVMLHRGFIYPLTPFALFLLGAPLVLRAARRSVWHGLSICVLIGIFFYAALISLSGWSLYTTAFPPALLLWGGLSPFAILGAILFAKIKS